MCIFVHLCFPPQVSVTAREDVPPFGPVLPDPPIFTEVGNKANINIINSISYVFFSCIAAIWGVLITFFLH